MASMAVKPHTIHAAKTQLSRLVARAQRGEEIVIARGARPVARLVAINAPAVRREFGAMRGRARVTPAFFEPLPADELAAWGE
jgi:prevent-host-death family protein